MFFRLGAQAPVDPVHLEVGDQLRLGDGPARWWWRVQAVSEHFAACVHQQPFEAAGVFSYTVLDWRNGIRGPCNLIGQGWGDGTYSEAECAELLQAFENKTRADAEAAAHIAAGHRSWPAPDYPVVEVSHRNRVPLVVEAVRRAKVGV